jgi:hypothetical protein
MNIGAAAKFPNFNDFEVWANVAYKRFLQRDDLGGAGLKPKEVQVCETELENVPRLVKLASNGDSLILPVTGHQELDEHHVRVCTPEPD